MRVCLFEHKTETLEPIALTRAAFDLRCGLLTLGEKQRRAFGAATWSAWVRPMLADLVRQMHPGVSVNDPNSNSTLWINARWLPATTNCLRPQGPCSGVSDGEIAWSLIPPNSRDLDGVLDIASALPTQPAGGAMIRYPWDLVDQNRPEIIRDVAADPKLPKSRHSATRRSRRSTSPFMKNSGK